MHRTFCGCFLQIPDMSIYIKSPAGNIVFCTQSEFVEFVIKYISNSKCFATVHFLHIGKKWLIFLSWLLGMLMQWSTINTHINVCLIGELDLYSSMVKETGKVWELQFIEQASISSSCFVAVYDLCIQDKLCETSSWKILWRWFCLCAVPILLV